MPPLKRHRKRGAGKSGGSSTSKSLRDSRNLIQSGKQADGLALLNRLSSENKNPGRRAKIALLIGTSESGLSRHTEAAAAFAKAGQLARQSGDPALALQAGIGEIRSLLRSLKTDEAKTAANLILQDLGKARQSFDDLADLRPEQLAAKGAVTLPPRPPRATVALTRIAAAFVQSGLTDEARLFLEKAIILSPNGASRARQTLARLALAADEPELAERHARESLQMGRFQAKTIAAWPLYLDARARQSKTPILEPSLFEALLQHATGRILSASVLGIVRVLRGHGDSIWKSIAETVLAKPAKADPVILTEIEKILHADAKLTLSEPSEIIAARSLKLFKAADASPAEQIAHAKTHIRHTLESGGTPNLAPLIKIARNRYGDDHATAIRHTTALAAMLARRHDLAREWLIALLDDLERGTEPWGKAIWALARMESMLDGRITQAAILYLRIAAEVAIAALFRVEALVRGLKLLSPENMNVEEITSLVRSILTTVDSYRTALDIARSMLRGGNALIPLKLEAAAVGRSLADEAIDAATTPQEQLSIIEYLARKQYWDLSDTGSIIARWNTFSAIRKAEFEELGGSLWYEYLALVFKALISEGRTAEAGQIAAQVIDRDKATAEGYVIVGSEYALWLLQNHELGKAFECFEWIAKESPTHRKAASSHYWIALRLLNEGNIAPAKACCLFIRRCFAGAPSLLSEWKLEAKAICILSDLSEEASVELAHGAFETKFLNQMINEISLERQSI